MSDTSYVIDVAANAPDIGYTAGELDSLTLSLVKAGANAETFEAATRQVSAQLAQAEAATKAANAALGEGNAKYSELERAAVKAAKAAEKASLAGKLDPAAAKSAYEARAAVEAYGHTLKSLEVNAAAAAKAEAKLTHTQESLSKLSKASAGAFADQEAAAKKSVKEAEGFVPLVKQFGDFSEAISTGEGAAVLAVGALAALATAVAAVTAALIVGTLAVAKWAIGLADARRDAGLTTQAAEALVPGLVELRGDFAALSDETGAGAADLRKWTKQLDQAKVSAVDLPGALRAVALSSAALGDEGVSEFMDQLKAAKGEAGDLAREVNAKLGPIVSKKMLGLDAQTKKLSKNFNDLFSGLNIDPVLEGMTVLVNLFDKTTVAGRAMQFLFESVFQPLIDQATNAAYVIEAFVIGFLIGMTKLYIALKPAIKAVSEFFGFKDTGLADLLTDAKFLGEAVAAVFAGLAFTFGIVVAAIGAVVGALFLAGMALGALISSVIEAGVAIYQGFIAAWNAVTGYLSGLPTELKTVGLNLMLGLANGITAGAAGVISSIVGVATGAIKAAKEKLGIASPSKVFADIGGFTGEGFAMGVDDSAKMAQDAMSAMVEPPAPGQLSSNDALSGNADAAQVGGGAKAASGKTVNIYGDLYFGGQKATEAEKRSLAEELTLLLEGDAAAIAGAA